MPSNPNENDTQGLKLVAAAVVAAAAAAAAFGLAHRPDKAPPVVVDVPDSGYSIATPIACPDGVLFVAKIEDCYR